MNRGSTLMRLARAAPLRRTAEVFAILAAVCLLIVATSAAQDTECVAPPGNSLPVQAYYIGQGDAHSDRALYTLALDDYSCAIEAAPDFASSYARRGYAYAALGDADAAFADFDQALALDETLVEAYVNRGVLYTRAGNFGLAISDFTLASSLDPQNTATLNNRALVHAIEGNIDLALQDVEQAIEIAPDDPAAYATRAAFYSALAAQDYHTFVNLSGGEERARLPAGTPTEVMRDVDDSLRTGNYAIWLALFQRGG